MRYRVYPDGTVLHEDDFAEHDANNPAHDDFSEYDLPEALEDYLQEVYR